MIVSWMFVPTLMQLISDSVVSRSFTYPEAESAQFFAPSCFYLDKCARKNLVALFSATLIDPKRIRLKGGHEICFYH